LKVWVSYAIGLGGVAGLAVAWVAVQRAWKRVFKSHCPDPDALTQRGECFGACGTKERDKHGTSPFADGSETHSRC